MKCLQGLHKVLTMCVTRFLQGVHKSACSVAATHKPPMPQVRLPAGASHLISPRIKAILAIIFHETRAVLGIEPRTSRTRSENHTTRPNSQLKQLGPPHSTPALWPRRRQGAWFSILAPTHTTITEIASYHIIGDTSKFALATQCFARSSQCFFTRLLQCLLTRLSQCFLRGFYKIVTMIYKAFTRP